jgi:ribosomal protein S12 methylthiotransferase
VNDAILKRMNRRGDHAYLDQLFTKLRAEIPGLVLRTSLIAGLPGEDEAAFEELCQFLRKHKLERVGAFVFSPEEGTAAAKMEYPPQEVAQERAEFLAELESRVIDGYNESRMGCRELVLCEGYDPEQAMYFGRSYAESPDIDGKIWFTSEQEVEEGQFATVEFDGVMDGELTGFACDEEDVQ